MFNSIIRKLGHLKSVFTISCDLGLEFGCLRACFVCLLVCYLYCCWWLLAVGLAFDFNVALVVTRFCCFVRVVWVLIVLVVVWLLFMSLGFLVLVDCCLNYCLCGWVSVIGVILIAWIVLWCLSCCIMLFCCLLLPCCFCWLIRDSCCFSFVCDFAFCVIVCCVNFALLDWFCLWFTSLVLSLTFWFCWVVLVYEVSVGCCLFLGVTYLYSFWTFTVCLILGDCVCVVCLLFGFCWFGGGVFLFVCLLCCGLYLLILVCLCCCLFLFCGLPWLVSDIYCLLL